MFYPFRRPTFNDRRATGPDDGDLAPSDPAPAPAPSAREPLRAWLTVVFLIFIFGMLARVVPAFHANLLALVAGCFLLVPGWFIPADEPGPEAYGLTLARAPTGVAIGLAAALVVLIGFVPAWHLWASRVEGRALDPDIGAWRQPPERLQGAPPAFLADRVYVYTDNDLTWVHLEPGNSQMRVTVSCDCTLRRTGDIATAIDSFSLTAQPGHPRRAIFAMRGGSGLSIVGDIGGRPLDPTDIAVGAGARTPRASWVVPGGATVPLGFRWLWLAIALQILLVALPEEFFFRGYMQRRLDQAGPSPRWQLGPFFVSRSILLVSIAFALTHLILTPFPGRLAVFFPSLAFGWLRDRTDGLAAPITFHAACNLMVLLAAPLYLPAP